MARIESTTEIRASPERCFDLARDIDLHVRSMSGSGERAVAGRTSGLIGLGEEVTFRGRHFGLALSHRARITAFERPRHFRDAMVQGHFKRFEHDHFFEPEPGLTRMRDVLVFESPFGVLGRVVDRLLLARHLRRVLEDRARAIREEAERCA